MSLLKIEWLYYFVALARSSSFSLASKELGISQQVLSYNIQQLEKHLGYELVERSYEGVKISDLGALLLEKSEQIIEQILLAEQNYISLNELNNRPQFFVGLSVWYPYIMDSLFLQLRAQDEFLLSLSRIIDSADKLQQAVLQRHLDMALVCGLVEHPNLVSHFIASSKNVIVASQNTPKPWDQWDYIQLESNLESLMPWSEESYPRNIIAKASSMAAVMMCQQGIGALMIPDISVSEHLKEGSLFIVAEPPVKHQFDCYLIWHKNQKHHDLLEQQYQIWRQSSGF